MLSYRKTKDGDWAVFGPAEELQEGCVVVRKKDGSTKEENVLKVSKTFEIDGIPHAYGFLKPPGKTGAAPAAKKCPRCDGKLLPSKFKEGQFYCPKKECREAREARAAKQHGRCYCCGSPYCDGARGGLCDDD